MHDWKDGKLPASLNSLFSVKVFRKRIRKGLDGKLCIPKIRTGKYGERSLRFAGSTILNQIIDAQINLHVRRIQFKRQLHALFIATY